MSVVVIVEPIGQGFRVRSGEPFPLCVEGPSREEALREFEAKWRETAQGLEIVTLPLPSGISLNHDDAWPNEELTELWRKGVEQYREQCDLIDDEWEKTEVQEK